MLNVVDWSKIVPDILAQIINQLEVVDCIRSSAVCRPWRSTICGGSYLCHPKSDQMPWLLLSSPDEGEVKFMYNPREGESLYKFDLPSISNHIIKGSSGGCIITIDKVGGVHATNPLTKAHRLLPDPATFTCLGELDIDPLHGIVKLAPLMSNFYLKVIIAPGFNGSMTVLIKSTGLNPIAIAYENENSWTEIINSPICNFHDALVRKGLLYAVSYTGELVVFDLHALPSPEIVIFIKDGPRDDRETGGKTYLVESLCGSDIFLIAKNTDYTPDEGDDFYSYHQTIGFDVLKLDETKHEWVEVSSFGDDVVVFVGYNQSIMLPTSDLPNGVVRKNCIYFTEDDYAIPFGEEINKKLFCEDIGVYCMESRMVTPFDLNAYELKRFTFPPPVWFVPTF